MNSSSLRSSACFLSLLLPCLGACSSGDDGKAAAKWEVVECHPDESGPVPTDRCTTDTTNTALPQCGVWTKVEPAGEVCGNGSQYKFFVNYSNTSNNVIVYFEPGGACWDYDSCSGKTGIRGAANPDGIPDDHMQVLQFLPLLTATDANPVKDYNKVFVSYCTGDIHTGNNVVTYTSPDGLDSITVRHAGHANSMAVIDWLGRTFPDMPRLLVSGCSAGGTGALSNYPYIRLGLEEEVQCGYLLNDSGPLFHSDGPSKQVQELVRSAWNTDPLIDAFHVEGVDPEELKADPGLINTAIARMLPQDRISFTAFRMDFNYSLYSYQRFFPTADEAQIHAYWWEDLQALMADYDQWANMSYYLPYFRSDNCSHCDTIPPIGNPPSEPFDATKAVTMPWLGTEIQASNIELPDYIRLVLDNTKPLVSYVEDVQPTEAFTTEVSLSCMEGGGTSPAATP